MTLFDLHLIMQAREEENEHQSSTLAVLSHAARGCGPGVETNPASSFTPFHTETLRFQRGRLLLIICGDWPSTRAETRGALASAITIVTVFTRATQT
jgi:hypothetical protein